MEELRVEYMNYINAFDLYFWGPDPGGIDEERGLDEGSKFIAND